MTTATFALDARSAKRHLEYLVSRALLRVRLIESAKAAALSLTVVAWLFVPMVLLQRLLSLHALGINIWILLAGMLALCIPYILWRAFGSHIHDQFAAVMADERLGLHARLSTALTLDIDEAPGFSEAFFAEAADKLARLDPEKAFPFQVPRLVYALWVPAGLAALLWYQVPQQDRAGFVAQALEKRRQEEVSRTAARSLDTKLQDLKKDRDEEAPEDSAEYKVNQLIKKADEISKELKEGKRDPNQAILALADLKREIGEEKEKLAESGKDFTKRLEELSKRDLNLEESDFTRAVSEALQEGDPEQAAREMRKLARQFKNEILNNDEMTAEQKAEALKKLRDEVERLAGALQDEGKLGEKLQELSQNNMDEEQFSQLQEQIKNFQDQNAKKGAEDFADQLEQQLNETAEELEEMADEEPQLEEDDEEQMDSLESLEESLDEAMAGLSGEG